MQGAAGLVWVVRVVVAGIGLAANDAQDALGIEVGGVPRLSIAGSGGLY